MRGLVRHLAAVVTLGSILACSGLGVCWKQFVRSAHDCCRQGEGEAAPAKSCASPGHQTALVKAVPPAAAAIPVLFDRTPAPQGPPASAFGPSFPVKSPRLVLRI